MLKLFREKGLMDPYRRFDQAHSPFHQARFNMEEKRSQLFPDRRRIPGRKAKAMLFAAAFLQVFGIVKLVEIKNHFKKKDQEMKKLQRKATPFLQAMDDIRYCAIHERNKILIGELFENKGKDYIERITKRFNSDDLWVPFIQRYPYMYLKTLRNIKPHSSIFFARYNQNYDSLNI